MVIVQALVMSRATHGAPYHGLKNSEKDKINTLIRRAHEIGLGLPRTTSTDKLPLLGIRNTWEELHEPHKASQIEQHQIDRARSSKYGTGHIQETRL
ncbi:hypothetical protein HPB50_002654 [Hyalomma asiaticum]|uniref:Uncharacterized protein n=1 Tax=Hyalomma asiaticum TaxID=266040 RepID=A0ACB7T7L7_HYAAI|nr:hypothetical protein HPB50_002654 [Hyalomma asiaticum]